MGWNDPNVRDEHGGVRIDCDTCVMRRTDACDVCVVTFLCSREPDEAVVIDVAEVRALRLLQRTLLAPGLRYEPDPGHRRSS